MKTLTVDEASRNLDSWLEIVHEEHESFQLVKDGVVYGQLVPVPVEGSSNLKLAADLARAKLTRADRREMATAVRKGRKHLKPVKNPWG